MVTAPDIPGHRVAGVLGSGGFATVYRSWQLAVGREVAVKVDNRVLLSERDQRRFFREVTAAGRLSGHPHVIDVYDGVRPPSSTDPGTADWNMSWQQWLAGGTAPSAAALALHPRMPRTYEPGFEPKVHVAKKSHHSKKSHKSATHNTNSSTSSSSSW